MFKCYFCSQGECKNNHMDIKLAKKTLKELKKMGVRYITYTGGEPLLYKNIIELVKYGHNLGFTQILVSNLYNMFVGRNEDILDYIDSIGVSFHGQESTYNKIVGNKNAFHILCKNIDRLLKMKKNININYTISKNNSNYEDMKFALEFAKKRNIRICFGRLNYIGLSKEETVIEPDSYLKTINDFKNIYEKVEVSNCIPACSFNEKYQSFNHGCGAGISMISINSNGDVTLCPSSKIVLGNVRKQKISRIWYSTYLKKFRNMKYLSNSCRICKHVVICKGGCHAEGTGLFFKDNCDAILIKKHDDIWSEIRNKNIYLKFNSFRKESKNYLIFGNPSRMINNYGFNIILDIDGKRTAENIVSNNKNIENAKDFIIALYLDGLIGV